ncbi:cytidylyltransferase domain-containing protein [Actinomadura sp. 6N118]|uniref:cytidylyltransferase domain-containing protein n=1 Tax=Actinomadura sp. 6N118 TaxID=3375151 RepID=UPI0037BA4EFD
MRVVCIIPARGGSKGVPRKNLARIGGRSLVTRAVQSALAAPLIDAVVVSTDDAEIAAEARGAGARVVDRPGEISGDTASSESALLHALDQIEESPEVTVMVQCTSPFIDPADLDAAVGRVLDGAADSVFAAMESHEFQWRVVDDRGVTAVGHDATQRPRRQDRPVHYRETGAFYVMRTAELRVLKHRFFGHIAAQPVRPEHAIEVDTATDLALARAVAPIAEPPEALDVDAVVTDFDGVHTDDRAWVDQDGTESVAVSRSDGMGVALLRRAGVPLLILSTEVNPVVAARARKLKVPVLHGLEDKAAALRKWMADEGYDPERVAYVGNDVNDLGCLALVGWPIAVPGSHPEVLAAARITLTRPGGAGAVRELCDRILRARGTSARTEQESKDGDI